MIKSDLGYFGKVVVLNYLRVIVGFLSLILVARALSVTYQGMYSLALNVSNISVKILNFSLPTSMIYFYPRVKDQKGLINSIFWLSLMLALVGGGITYVVLKFVYSLSLPLVIASVSLFAFLLLYTINSGYIQAIGRVDIFALWSSIGTSLKFLLITIFLFVLNLRTPVSVMFCGTISQLFLFLLALYSIHKYLVPKIKLVAELVVPIIKYTIWTHLHNLLWYMVLKSDILLIGYLLDEKAVGYYSIASLVGDGIRIFSSSINQALFPRLVRQTSFRTVLKYMVAPISALVLGGIIFSLTPSFWIAFIFGKKYLPSTVSTVIVAWAAIVLSINSFFSYYLLARGKPWINTLSSGTGFLSNLLLNLWLIPKMGINGAAIASLISYAMMLAINSVAVFRVHGLPGNGD